MRCLLCNAELRSTIVDPADGERHEVLVCGRHSDQQLRDQGLDDLWGGVEPAVSTSFFQGPARHVTGVWEQGEGAYSVHILLEDGDLLTVLSWGSPTVHAARLRRSQRALERPVGVPACERAPWAEAVRDRWQLSALQPFADGSVAADLVGHGRVLFTTYGASWRELGEYRHLLHEAWNSAAGSRHP